MKRKMLLIMLTMVLAIVFPLTAMAAPGSPNPMGPWEQQADGTWKYVDGDHYACNQLVSWKGQTFYLDADGTMAKGWRNVNGQYYYFNDVANVKFQEGAMLTDTTTPDGRQVDANGMLIGAFDPNQRPNPYGNHTCVEVDITNQAVYVYVGYNLVASGPCVTGRMTPTRQTTVGDFSIYSKETDRYLQGTNEDGSKYKSHVNFWMPYNQGQGLHDATWRSNFGGQIYVNSGSHGCVNLPYDLAAQLFNVAYVGMPVHVHN